MKQSLISILTLAFFTFSQPLTTLGQETSHVVCGTSDSYEALKKANPDLERLEKEANRKARQLAGNRKSKQKKQRDPRVIPVVFHVIHGGGDGNIDREKLLDNLERLNVDFQKRNEDTVEVSPVFKNRIADYNIEFRLAKRTPNGECFDGITREYHPGLTNDSIWLNTLPDFTNQINYWNPEHYLNIWVVRDIYDNNPNSDIAGQANYPWSEDGADGIIMRSDQISYNDRTLTHEVGHYLGLYHPFHGGCSTGDCENQNDQVCDVPSTEDRETVTDCGPIGNTCDGAEWRIDSLAILDTPASPTDIPSSNLNEKSLYLEDFENPTALDTNWRIFSGGSEVDWVYEKIDGRSLASIKGNQADTPNNDWLISPPLKFDESDTSIFFSLKNVRISEGGTFSIKITNNYDSTSKPTDSSINWVDITEEFELSEGFFDDNFTNAYNLNDFNKDTFHIALQYQTTPEVHLPDMKTNYMDYTNCRRMFSEGQKERSDTYLNDTQYRKALISDQNLIRTGVKNQIDGVPSAYFQVEQTKICKDEEVKFENLNCQGTADSIIWYFEGGVPENSNKQNPLVQYQEPGSYDVSLILKNSKGADTLFRANYIRVFDAPKTPVKYTFENGNPKSSGFVFNPNFLGNQWQLTRKVGVGDDHSLYLGTYNINEEQDVSFRTPSVDISESEEPVLRFDMAYATRSSNSNDILLLESSNDCGETWKFLNFLFTSDIRTQSNVQSPYFPTNLNEWKTHEVALDDLEADSNILIRFVMQTDNGNNAFIDNIRLERKRTGMENSAKRFKNIFRLYPNPVEEELIISSNLRVEVRTNIEVFNSLGQSLHQAKLEWNPGETKNINPSKWNINRAGHYIVKIRYEDQVVNKHLIMTK